MKVFLSWSGEPSRSVALLLRDWLPNVMQFARPFMSEADLPKGARWFEVIGDRLRDADAAIICLTSSNQKSPWINFEAGAIANRLELPKVSALLIDLRPGEVVGPLSAFNHTVCSPEDVRRLLAMLNEQAEVGIRLSEAHLDRGFEKWWPDWEAGWDRSVEAADAGVGRPPREMHEMVEEVLVLVRGIARRSADIAADSLREAILRNWVESAASYLPDRERKILALRYGLWGAGGSATLGEIGSLMGLSATEVGQLRDRALARLRDREAAGANHDETAPPE